MPQAAGGAACHGCAPHAPGGQSRRGADCGLFQPIRLVQEAWGLRNALDRLPHKEAVTVKKRLNHLYTRPTLSRIMNHQRSIPPAEQAALLKLFAAAGVPADQVFDRVQLSYDWTARP